VRDGNPPAWGEELRSWVEGQGPFVPDLEGFAGAFGRRLVAAGLGVVRLAFNVQLLHPRLQARTVWWERAEDRAGRIDWPRTVHETDIFKRSPMAVVIGEGLELRYRLDSAEADHPIDKELRARGAVEYLGLPLPGPTELPHAISIAVDGAGFAEDQIEGLRALSGPLSEICDARVLMESVSNLPALWMGKNREHVDGAGQSGDAQHLHGAFLLLAWIDFPAQALEGAPGDALARLSQWHDICGRMVHRREGEILERSGARVLAFFPSPQPGGENGACTRALDAARTVRAAAFDLGELERSPPRLPEIRTAIDLRTALYGATGSANHLHFTISGDVRGRLSSMLEQGIANRVAVVTSEAVAGQLGGGKSLGAPSPRGAEGFALHCDPDADTLL
jgi:adenylate cyclase